jgi:hypothetical protein
MKKLLGFVALVLVSQMSFATSMVNNRLVFQDVPKPGVMGGQTRVLTVDASGTVIYRTSQAIPGGAKSRVVANLTAFQMDRIERLIERAKKGAIVNELYRVACFAPSMNTINYSAANGFVFLKSGTICDGITINNSFAAKRLVNIIDRLLALTNATEVANEVELDLN